ncbi:helix-turn-helix domain-containing protein [Streptomyces sp. NPDC003393]
MSPRSDLEGGRGASTECVRPVGEHGGGQEAAADQPECEGPGETPPGDRGADVRPGPDGQGHHCADAGQRGYVRDVIHAFNEQGLDALDPKRSGGRPKTISDRVREHICLIARTPPDWKITAFSTWSLSKLADH